MLRPRAGAPALSAVCEKEHLECGSMGEWTPQKVRCVPMTGSRFLMCAVKHEGKQSGLLLSVCGHM